MLCNPPAAFDSWARLEGRILHQLGNSSGKRQLLPTLSSPELSTWLCPNKQNKATGPWDILLMGRQCWTGQGQLSGQTGQLLGLFGPALACQCTCLSIFSPVQDIDYPPDPSPQSTALSPREQESPKVSECSQTLL